MPGMLQIEALAQVSAMLLIDPDKDEDFSNQEPNPDSSKLSIDQRDLSSYLR